MRRTKEEAAATRKILLDAALRVFSEKGYSATRLEDIAERVGMTRGAIYWHFQNKAELYNTLMTDYSNQVEQIIMDVVNEDNSIRETLRQILTRLFASLETDPTFRAINELALFKTEMAPELAEGWQMKIAGYHQSIAQISVAVREGIAAGDLRADLDPITAARAFIAFTSGVTTLWLIDPSAFSLKEQAPMLTDVFIRGLIAAD
jgi:TetR/AcrR family acrAB operon transcriptional repressor